MTLPPSDGAYEIDCHAVASELREDMTITNIEAVSDAWSLLDEREKQFRLWFFRDLSTDQRMGMFRLMGLPVDELRSLGHQQIALDHVLSRRAANSAGGVAEPVAPFLWLTKHDASEIMWGMTSNRHITGWRQPHDKQGNELVPLYTHPSSPVSAEVTESWRIVPSEPTDEMASAVIALDPKADFDARYRAAVSVAPSPEVFGFVPLSVYESAVKGRQDFRSAFRQAKGITEAKVVQMLRDKFDASGLSYDKYGESVGLSGEFIRSVLTGIRAPSKAVLDLIEVEAVTVYRLKLAALDGKE